MRARRTVLSAAILLGIIAAPALADGSFVKIGDIKGTATELQHQGWIEIGTWGMDKKDSGPWYWPFGTPKTNFWFDKRPDVSSPALQKAMAGRTLYPRVVFDFEVKGTIYRTTLYDARIVSVETQNRSEKVTVQFKRQTEQQLLLVSRKN